MKETGIIMSGNHPKLILDGIKTMTRRVIKPQPKERPLVDAYDWWHWVDDKGIGHDKHCPYGQVGDKLWVREAYAVRLNGVDQIMYKSDYNELVKMLDLPEFDIRWKPSIHMFRKDSRITLEITEVRVERLQDITEEDAEKEGESWSPAGSGDNPEIISAVENFAYLWDSLNAKRGYGWEVNPWVWVISFKKL